jgi:hypothetical protein
LQLLSGKGGASLRRLTVIALLFCLVAGPYAVAADKDGEAPPPGPVPQHSLKGDCLIGLAVVGLLATVSLGTRPFLKWATSALRGDLDPEPATKPAKAKKQRSTSP